MTAVYFVWVLFILSSNFERDVSAAPSPECQSVAVAVTKNSAWTFHRDKKVLQWIRPSSEPKEVPRGFCDPAVGELGDVTRIDLTDSKTGALFSNQVCSGCPGEEIADGEVRFSADENENLGKFGPCDGITAYRCRCPEPTTTTTQTTTTESMNLFVTSGPK